MKYLTLALLIIFFFTHPSMSFPNTNMDSLNLHVDSLNVHIVEPPAHGEKTNWIVIATGIGILGSVLSWLYNEWQKRKLKLLTEKEERYGKLIKNIRYLSSTSKDVEKGNEFFDEFLLCWMYCPDNIIQKGNAYLDSMNAEKTKVIDPKNTEKLKGEFILELRKDLKGETKLTSEDLRDLYQKQ